MESKNASEATIKGSALLDDTHFTMGGEYQFGGMTRFHSGDIEITVDVNQHFRIISNSKNILDLVIGGAHIKIPREQFNEVDVII